MSAVLSWNLARESMPQIVPTAGFSPSYCDYTAFTTDFDLSLLPESPECQVPLSPCAPFLSLEDGLFDSFGILPTLKSCHDIKSEPADEPLHTPLKKTLSSGFFPDMDISKTELKKEDPLIPITVPSVKIKEEPADAEVPTDHQLLRSVLKDTSFQRKYNIRAFELPTQTSTSMSARPDMDNLEPVLDLAIQQVTRDIDNTCSALGIAKDPTQWIQDDVRAWLLWTARQYNLPSINTDNFRMDGASLSQLTEDEFLQRSPQSGSALQAHLEIWKAASLEPPVDLGTQWSPPVMSSNSSSAGDLTDEEDEEMDVTPAATLPASPTSEAGTSAGTSKRSTGAHIHLWQFLKELLSEPAQHGTCIRWLDRQSGVFKIEDSVRVAKLWGKRKNRPAMNYDKLSRSIRQYYKKGIMKKTERSQRLVYQFCHPYCL